MARPNDPVAAIDTPALVIDLDAMERSLARMAAFARAAGEFDLVLTDLEMPGMDG